MLKIIEPFGDQEQGAGVESTREVALEKLAREMRSEAVRNRPLEDAGTLTRRAKP